MSTYVKDKKPQPRKIFPPPDYDEENFTKKLQEINEEWWPGFLKVLFIRKALMRTDKHLVVLKG